MSVARPPSAEKIRHAFMLTEDIGRPQPDMLAGLDAAGRARVLQKGRSRRFAAGPAVFAQGEKHDGIYLIEDGLVRVFYTAPSGREITLAYWMAGNFVGGPEVFGTGVHVWSGIAERDTRVLALSGAVLRGLVDALPPLAIGVIEGLVFKGNCYSLLAQMLGTRSVVERLAYVLQRLCQLYGVAGAEGIVVATPFTHDDLAHMVGSTRQWVSMTLRRFADQGILVVSRKHLVVLRADLLAEQAHMEEPGR